MLQEGAAVLPEIAVSGGEATQLRQLRTGEEQRHTALEPDHDALGDEVDDRAGLDQPGDDGDEPHEDGRAEPASAVNRAGSPPEMVPSVEPINSEMAEVTEMVVCRELQNSQKTSPPNMHA